MKRDQALILAAVALTSCGKPQTVGDFKTALVRLGVAGAAGQTQLASYDALLLDTQTKFELAKKDLSGEAAITAATALAKAQDAQAVWQGTEVIDGVLSPDLRAPLERLGVAKNDADFEKRSNIFIAFEENPDDDTPRDTAEKKSARDEARGELVRQSLAVADQALAKAADGL